MKKNCIKIIVLLFCAQADGMVAQVGSGGLQKMVALAHEISKDRLASKPPVCQGCTWAVTCPVYQKAMMVAKGQERGTLKKDDYLQAAASTVGSGMTGSVAFWLSAAPELWPVTLSFASASAVFAWRARNALWYGNDGWRLANTLRASIADRRLNYINALLGSLNAGAYASKGGIGNTAIALGNAAIAVHSISSIEKMKRDQLKTCCRVQMDLKEIQASLPPVE